MSSTVIVALISFAGTLIGTAGGIFASAKLTEYRLSQLEKKVEAQNSGYAKIPLIEERISNISKRLYIVERRQPSDFSASFTRQ